MSVFTSYRGIEVTSQQLVTNQESKTCDIRTTRRARSNFPSRNIRRKVGEIGKAAAKSSAQLLQTTRKSILEMGWNGVKNTWVTGVIFHPTYRGPISLRLELESGAHLVRTSLRINAVSKKK